jgi:hypothetical protein
MSERVAQLVGVHLADAGPLASAAEHGGDARLVQRAPAGEPQPVLGGVGVPGSSSRVAVEGPRGVCPERAATPAPALPEHVSDLLPEVEILDRHRQELAATHPGVVEEPDDGGADVLERAGPARAQQRLHLLLAEHRHGLRRNRRRRHAPHRRLGNLALVDEEPEELLQGSEPVARRRWLPVLEEVLHVCLDVLSPNGGGLRRHPPGGEEGAELVHRLEVGSDGPGRAVGRTKAQLEAGGDLGDLPHYHPSRRHAPGRSCVCTDRCATLRRSGTAQTPWSGVMSLRGVAQR